MRTGAIRIFTFRLQVSRVDWLQSCHPPRRRISVRAGFTNHELSGLWPGDSDWQLKEGAAGLFSHLFVASKRGVTSEQGRI